MTGARLALVVPAHHPISNLADLIREMLAADPALFTAAFVVDDGNEAEQQGVFDAVARVPGAIVVRRRENGGKGAALKTGIRAALEAVPDLRGVVTADADGQHAPADVARVGRALAASPTHLVLGARRFGPKVPFRNRAGNEITRSVFRWVTGAMLLDTQTGLRGWPRAALERNLAIAGDGFEYEVATLLAALDMPRTEIPIETIYRDSNRLSHFRPVQDSLRIYSCPAAFPLQGPQPAIAKRAALGLRGRCYYRHRTLPSGQSTKGYHHEPTDLDRSYDRSSPRDVTAHRICPARASRRGRLHGLAGP